MKELKELSPNLIAAEREAWLRRFPSITTGDVTRAVRQSSYAEAMNTAKNDKLEHTLPYLMQLQEKKGAPLSIVSFGAGTGSLEADYARLLPHCHIFAIDYAPAMIAEITKQAAQLDAERRDHPQIGTIIPLFDNALDTRIATQSADAVAAISSIHEVSSFADDHTIGEHTKHIFQESARILRPGGRFLIRDFMQPDNPDEHVMLEVGAARTGEMDPALFLYAFAEQFQGDDLGHLAEQLRHGAMEADLGGMRLVMPMKHAFEITAHYSWQRSFMDEVKEKYAYMPMREYAQFVQRIFLEEGYATRIHAMESYLQPGYVEHIQDRFTLYDMSGNKKPLPHFTGVIVVEKQ
jgi:SAM-dependent methyltransferase